MKRILLLLMSLLLVMPVLAQDNPSEDLPPELLARLEAEGVDAVWEDLTTNSILPYIEGDQAVFMYRRGIGEVQIAGDFNFWTPTTMYRYGETDLWYATYTFPDDARLEYKIVLDGSTWLQDPKNPRRQVGGFGPNTEMAMPNYEYSEWIEPREGIPQGQMQDTITLDSEALDTRIIIRVYTPANVEDFENLPTFYITDGHEFAKPDMGSATVVFDNMLSEGVIEPAILVFIDPRDPDRPTANRRRELYVENPAFSDFIAEQLVPYIDETYPTSGSAEDRVMLGTSYGGIHALSMGYLHPDVFGNIVAISPSPDWEEMYDNYVAEENPLPIRLLITAGRWDVEPQPFYEALVEQGWDVDFIFLNEGHSWGAWRALMDDVFLYFIPAE